jgi:hypothetical protein
MTMLAAPARTRADRDVAAFSPAQIEQIRAIVREELAARVRPLPRVDHAVLARLLPALGGAYGSDEWLASEAVQHPALNPVIGGWPAGRLGKLLRRATGVIVNGDDVTIYGLFVEHCQEYQTIWNGEGGRVYFYQSEMPYDPPTQDAWSHDDVRGYASYKVADGVTTHEAWGLGVYCVFRAGPIIADTAIEAPTVPGVKMHHMVTIRLSGQPGSGIGHVINNQGDAVITRRKATVK